MNVFRRRSLDAESDAELQFHIEQRTRDNNACGMTTDEARDDAERRFGGRLRAHEQTRDADVLVWVGTIGQDVQYAVRNLRVATSRLWCTSRRRRVSRRSEHSRIGRTFLRKETLQASSVSSMLST
jgi:hypothetical protein